MSARWVFDPLPSSGARRGGNPAEHAFTHDLATFVREVVQNANDQAKLRPRVRFRYLTMRDGRRERFLHALDWKGLKTHVAGAVELADTARIRSSLESLHRGEALHLLFVDDFGTDGLTGGEDEAGSHFRALCKDTLFSHKGGDAGGSYGLGKSVLWTFSSLSTVLFCSTLIETNGEQNPRLIGRAEFGSHQVRSDAFQGPGWFGRRAGPRAESLWGKEAADVSASLGFQPREDHQPGTSICVVGFKDPTADIERTSDELAAATRIAVADYFWPSMALSRRALSVSTESEGQEERFVQPETTSVAPFVDGWRRYLGGERGERLERPGDLAVVALPFSVPATHDGDAARTCEVSLIVRLSEAGAQRRNELAMFRGPGMVVRYRDRSRIGLGMRPFHALLACGTARNPTDPSDADRAVEAFLRMAEPPSHDRWIVTGRLKARYRRGYAKALRELETRVDEALRQLTSPTHRGGTAGPERLQRRFPIGKAGAAKARPSPFSMRGLFARRDGDVWSFGGVVERTEGKGPWTATLRLSEVDEGRLRDRIPVADVRVDEGVDVHVEATVVHLSVPPDRRIVSFRGLSTSSTFIGALEIELVGSGGGT